MPFLCWTTQFHIMTGFAREEKKQSDQIEKDQKEIADGDQQKQSLQVILDNFKQENLK